jgi:GT2 family glycosyltransferase
MRFPNFFDPPFHRLGFHKRYNFAKKRVEEFLMSDFSHTRVVPVDWVVGAAMFIRGSALKDAGLFDERFFMYFEDCDLCRRIWDARWMVYYKGDLTLRHSHERASAKIPGLRSIFQNKLTRIHLKSWLQYWWKWLE